ncbi:hypothetical protein CCHR01_02764 [Colletotrichum chrysophilum]|uniref:Uncharacterized protein n=1 Tax=Colletotrichum chrysophilum TaxID=1836956 RepID=A0AAD9AWE7_9PEZI|nr:hypothetical protein CCHR01_02764 [Colletotrichum chrysophilum]
MPRAYLLTHRTAPAGPYGATPDTASHAMPRTEAPAAERELCGFVRRAIGGGGYSSHSSHARQRHLSG